MRAAAVLLALTALAGCGKPAAPAAAPPAPASPTPDQRTLLCGDWLYQDLKAAAHGGSRTLKVTFMSDGRYASVLDSSGTETGLAHVDEKGAWSLEGNQLTVEPENGLRRTIPMELRAPSGKDGWILVLEGMEFARLKEDSK